MYIEEGYRSLHEGWRYFIGILIIMVGWQIVGFVPLIVGVVLKSDNVLNALSNLDVMAADLGSNLFFFLLLLSFAIGLATLFFTSKVVHKQSLTSLTTSRKKIDWKRVMFSFVLWGIVSLVLLFLDIWLSPENYEFNLKLGPFLILVVIALIMIPLQTSFEEYLMRGYVMQGLGIIVKNRWVPLLITSSVFGLLHIFNPEVEKLGYGIMVFYIGTGLLLGIMTLMDEGLELAIGFHAVNNLVAAIFVTAEWTAFETDSLYKDISEPELGWSILLPVLVIYPILLLILSKKYGWSNWKEKLTGKVLSKEDWIEKSGDELGLH